MVHYGGWVNEIFLLFFFFSASLSLALTFACTIKPVDSDTLVSIEKVPINGASVLSGRIFNRENVKEEISFPKEKASLP